MNLFEAITKRNQARAALKVLDELLMDKTLPKCKG